MPTANEINVSGPRRQRRRVADQVLVEELPTGELVMLHVGTEEYFGLDPVGARFLIVLCESGSVEEAGRRLVQEYDVEASELLADLDELVEELSRHGLLEFDAL
jgi:hypothetical protein